MREIRVEICSNCHPFYTGKQKLVDTGGRVERFQRRYAQDAGRQKGLTDPRRASGDARWPRKRTPPAHFYGGQAVVEGVMMRGRDHWAVAVRRPGGDLTSSPTTSTRWPSGIRSSASRSSAA